MKKVIALTTAFLLGMLLSVNQASAAEEARIHLIHGIPDVNVDVIVDGDVVFENFAFKDTQDLASLAGQTLAGLKVNVAGTDTTVIDAGDVALPASGNYTIFAHLDADGNPALAVFENDVSALDAGAGRLIVRHAAAAPAVDILADGAVAFANVVNGAEGSADLPAGTISAEVVPTGETSPVVIGPADLPITEGSVLIVYATGSLDDGLEVVTESIADIGSHPAAIHTGDSPVQNNSLAMAGYLAGGGVLLLLALGFQRQHALRKAEVRV